MNKVLLILSIFIGSVLTTQAQQAKDAPAKQEIKEEKKEEIKALDPDANLYEDEEGNFVETTKPIFNFLSEETHNFGELDEGPKYDHEFKFENIGKEPMIIAGVKASCGCTTPDWPKEPIMPGEVGAIKVIYNTKGRKGKFNKAVTITSNSVTPTKRLYIKGNVNEAAPDQPVKPKSLIENK